MGKTKFKPKVQGCTFFQEFLLDNVGTLPQIHKQRRSRTSHDSGRPIRAARIERCVMGNDVLLKDMVNNDFLQFNEVYFIQSLGI